MPKSGNEARQERITATGWRIVGSAAEELVERAAMPPLHAEQAERAAISIVAQVRPLLGTSSALPTVLDTISRDLLAAFPGIAPLSRDRPASRPVDRTSGFRWEVDGAAGAWVGELLWRHPHPVRAGRQCTTHLIISEQGPLVSVAIRVAPDQHDVAGRATAEVVQLRPAFLAELARMARLWFDGLPAGPIMVEESEVDPTLVDLLLSESRTLPVVVLAPLEGGGYLIEPEVLAAELLGIAHLRVLATHPCTFRLTDALGDRRLSAYWGAMRAYLPGFSCADDPRSHPLLRRDEIGDPVLRAFVVGRLAAIGVGQTKWPRGIPSPEEPPVRVVAEAPAPEAAVRSPDRPVAAELAAGPAQAASLDDPARVLDRLDALLTLHQKVVDELEQMRTTLAVRSAGTVGLERRLSALERLLSEHLVPPAEIEAAGTSDEPELDREGEAQPSSLHEVVLQAEEQDGDALLVLDSAERSAQDSPYEDPERVRAILDAMALVARRRQEGKLGRSLKDAFRELGVDYRGGISESSSQALREQHRFRGARGTEYFCDEHIALGNSYDPRHCLRIYFTSRAPNETRFVIGHVGRHLDVQSTS